MTRRKQQNSRNSSKEKSGRERSGNRNHRRRRRPHKTQETAGSDTPQQSPPPPVKKHIPKRYGVVFYDTLNGAKEDQPRLLDKAKEVDQLNIVIRAEAPMDDAELLQYGKLYAGAAWALIHDRRVEEGWYNEPH